jgi:hypothetical protein
MLGSGPQSALLWRRVLATTTTASMSAGCAWALTDPSRGACAHAEAGRGATPLAHDRGVARLAVRELVRGSGDREAADGMVVSVHCRVRIAESGVELERTRGSSGSGDRMYGEPMVFVLGDVGGAAGVLGAVHVATVGMRAGGVREVRVAFQDPDFGYRTLPQDEQGRRVVLHSWAELLVEVELQEIRHLIKPRADPWASMQRFFGL